MTREELREQLARLADEAPVASVPDDTFARGRRAVVRARVGGAVLAAACLVVASVLGGLALGHRSDEAQVTDPSPSGTGLGVPDHIWAPPHPLRADPDAKVGRAAAAYVDTRGEVMVVGATDGSYHRVDVPSPRAAGAQTLAVLSPDGRWLAATRTLRTSSDGRARSGIVLIDLETGITRFVDPEGGRLNLLSLAWSPNGRWLGWQGVAVGMWDAEDFEPTGHYFVGTLGVPDLKQTRLPALGSSAEVVNADGRSTADSERPRPIAVSDRGELALVAGETLWRDGRRTHLALPRGTAVGALWFRGDAIYSVDYPLRYGKPVSLGVATDATSRSGVFGVTTPRYLGTTPGGQVLLQHDGSREQYEDATTVIAVPQHLGVALGSRPVVTVAPDVVRLSLATGLMPADHPTVHRGEPDWPWSTAQRAAAYAGSGVAVLLLVGLAAWAWRRRRLA